MGLVKSLAQLALPLFTGLAADTSSGIGMGALSAASPPADFDIDRFLEDFENSFNEVVSNLNDLDLASISLEALEADEELAGSSN